jgi:hypothetical protein
MVLAIIGLELSKKAFYHTSYEMYYHNMLNDLSNAVGIAKLEKLLDRSLIYTLKLMTGCSV